MPLVLSRGLDRRRGNRGEPELGCPGDPALELRRRGSEVLGFSGGSPRALL